MNLPRVTIAVECITIALVYGCTAIRRRFSVWKRSAFKRPAFFIPILASITIKVIKLSHLGTSGFKLKLLSLVACHYCHDVALRLIWLLPTYKSSLSDQIQG